jgi:hypothetical protein
MYGGSDEISQALRTIYVYRSRRLALGVVRLSDIAKHCGQAEYMVSVQMRYKYLLNPSGPHAGPGEALLAGLAAIE